jgi:hypothetical protein
MKELIEKLDQYYEQRDGIHYSADSEGYWSNFSKEDQDRLFSSLKDKPSNEVIAEQFPQYYDMIYNNSRCVGLELLQIGTEDIGIDYGCMWGNVLVYCAKQCKGMIGVDQTEDSLRFLKKRLSEEKLDNGYLVNTNLRNDIDLSGKLDFSVINGVMEWVPDTSTIDLKNHFKKSKFKFVKPKNDPKSEQIKFLKMANNNLKVGGKLYLAIENRYDYQHFLWKKDPHSNLMYTAFMPRLIANIISNIYYGRPYVNYIYSKKDLKKMLSEAGFAKTKVYATFPDYRFPQKIISTDKQDTNDYSPVYTSENRKDLVARIFYKTRKLLDVVIYKKMKLFSLAPSFIVIAEK